jgi:hypothetical protein
MLVAHIFTGNFFTKYHQLKLNSQQPFNSPFYFKSPFSSPENPQDGFPVGGSTSISGCDANSCTP